VSPVVAFAVGALIAALLLWAVAGDEPPSKYDDEEERGP
jgi:nitrogen fixation-related uncharacterized protein